MTVAGIVLVTLLVSGYVWWARTPANLVYAGSASTAEWRSAWQAGDVVALVRHVERCDRSTNPCLGPADGITQSGKDSAVSVGRGFAQLGLQKAQVFSSPLTRTVQTDQYMFGHEVVTQEWLEVCGPTLRDDVIAHKNAHQNLVLVTHSGCVSDFEKQTGYPRAATAEYGSALLVRVDAQGQLKVLGILNADAWARINK